MPELALRLRARVPMAQVMLKLLRQALSPLLKDRMGPQRARLWEASLRGRGGQC